VRARRQSLGLVDSQRLTVLSRPVPLFLFLFLFLILSVLLLLLLLLLVSASRARARTEATWEASYIVASFSASCLTCGATSTTDSTSG
jgi:ABC-type sulfate transport system permease component